MKKKFFKKFSKKFPIFLTLETLLEHFGRTNYGFISKWGPSCAWIFFRTFSLAWIFFGHFPLHNYFLVFPHPPPPPYYFSNGPSLIGKLSVYWRSSVVFLTIWESWIVLCVPFIQTPRVFHTHCLPPVARGGVVVVRVSHRHSSPPVARGGVGGGRVFAGLIYSYVHVFS